MKIGDLVKLQLDDDDHEIGLIIKVENNTIPEKIWIKGLDGKIYTGWDDECEVINESK